jgi:arylsulfatase A-like enzyme
MKRHCLITKNLLLAFLGFCCLGLSADVTGLENRSEKKAPNIIYILADDMGYSDLGCYGGEIETPAIDRLANEGLRFRQFYNQAKCEPTRTAVMTGMYHGRAGLSLQNPGATLGEALRTADYRTYIIGKWHLPANPTRKEQTPVERGFDAFYGLYDGASSYFPSGIGRNIVSLDSDAPGEFITPYSLDHFRPHDQWGLGEDAKRFLLQSAFPEGFYMTDAFGDHAVHFIDDAVSNHPDRPFFLYLSFNAPHTPLQAPVPLIEKYRGYYSKGWDQIREEKWQRIQKLGLVDPQWKLPPWRMDVPAWENLSEEEKEKEAHRRAVYAAMVDNMDQNIAKVLDRLDQLGIAENTLVVFMSDNGSQAFDNTSYNQRLADPSHPDSRWCMGAVWASLSNMPFRYNKQSQHMGGICSPFVARWPAVIEAGGMTDEPGHIIDLMATFVDIGNADYNSLDVPPMDGESLMPVFEGGTRQPPLWGFEFGQTDFAVIQGNWKLVNFRSGPWRLYDLKEDRTEMNNLAWKYPEKVKELAGFHYEWAMDVFGNRNRTHSGRNMVISENDAQHMRYTAVLNSDRLGFYSNPPVKVDAGVVGEVQLSDVREAHEVWSVTSRGSGLIQSQSDGFTYISMPLVGDGEVIAYVERIEEGADLENLLLGVMMRESKEPGSPFVMTALNPASGSANQLNRSKSHTASSLNHIDAGIKAPLFIRLRRDGNLFTSSYSSDTYVWTDFSVVSVSLTEELHAGLAVSSGGNETARVIFREWDNIEF